MLPTRDTSEQDALGSLPDVGHASSKQLISLFRFQLRESEDKFHEQFWNSRTAVHTAAPHGASSSGVPPACPSLYSKTTMESTNRDVDIYEHSMRDPSACARSRQEVPGFAPGRHPDSLSLEDKNALSHSQMFPSGSHECAERIIPIPVDTEVNEHLSPPETPGKTCVLASAASPIPSESPLPEQTTTNSGKEQLDSPKDGSKTLTEDQNNRRELEAKDAHISDDGASSSSWQDTDFSSEDENCGDNSGSRQELKDRPVPSPTSRKRLIQLFFPTTARPSTNAGTEKVRLWLSVLSDRNIRNPAITDSSLPQDGIKYAAPGRNESNTESNSKYDLTHRSTPGQMIGQKRGPDRDRDDEGDLEGNGNPGKKPSKREALGASAIRRRFACPLQKVNPRESQLCGSRTAKNPWGGFPSVHRVKSVSPNPEPGNCLFCQNSNKIDRQHILRHHVKTSWCQKCWTYQENQQRAELHPGSPGCVEMPCRRTDWLNHEQLIELQVKLPYVNQLDNWYHLLFIIFPSMRSMGPMETLGYTPYYEISQIQEINGMSLIDLPARSNSTASMSTSAGKEPQNLPSTSATSFEDYADARPHTSALNVPLLLETYVPWAPTTEQAPVDTMELDATNFFEANANNDTWLGSNTPNAALDKVTTGVGDDAYNLHSQSKNQNEEATTSLTPAQYEVLLTKLREETRLQRANARNCARVHYELVCKIGEISEALEDAEMDPTVSQNERERIERYNRLIMDARQILATLPGKLHT